MKIMFITAWDASAPGIRQIFSIAKSHKVDASLLHFKDLHIKHFQRKSYDEIADAKKRNPYSVVESLEEGDCIIPYCYPAPDSEIELFRESVRKNGADFTAFAAYWTNLETVITLTKHTRDVLPKSKIIWGGLVPSFKPELAINFADIIFSGEADLSFQEFLKNPLNNNIDGVWSKKDSGEIIRNRPSIPIQNLDELPCLLYGENESLIDGERIIKAEDLDKSWLQSKYIFSSSRGCPFKCSYCIHGNRPELPKGMLYYRRKSVNRFVTELKNALSRFQFPHFDFWDDIFACDENWLLEFRDKYKREINIPFCCNAHTLISKKNTFEILYDAGCRFVTVGLQSGCEDKNSDIYNRNIPVGKFKETIINIKGSGIPMAQVDLIASSPFEIEEDLKSTLEILASLPKPTRNHQHHLVFYPGISISEKYENAADIPPKISDRKIRHLYNALFILAGEPEITREILFDICGSGIFRKKPELADEIINYVHKKQKKVIAIKTRIKFLLIKNLIKDIGGDYIPFFKYFIKLQRKIRGGV